PGLCRLRGDELEAERAHAPLPRASDGCDVRAGDPEGRMRLLEWLGDHVARREVEEAAVVLDGLLGEALHHHLHRFLPHLPLVAPPPAEGMELDGPLPFAQAKLHSPARDEVEGRNALRHADGMVGGELDDAVAQADARGALARRSEEYL